MKVRKLRLLREKHGIQLRELGAAAGLSLQRISELEYSEHMVTDAVKSKILGALLIIISDRLANNYTFSEDLDKHKESLFELVEDGYEL